MTARGHERLATSILDGLGRGFPGLPSRLTPLIVDQLGPAQAVGWYLRNVPRYEHTLRITGPLRTHLACMAISLHNGCRYSSFGHAYAAELIYLRDRDRLLPVDAETVSGWVGLAPGELRDRLCDVLQRADLHSEVLWVDRTLAFAAGAQRAVDHDEARIAHLVRMFGVLNAACASAAVSPDEAHDSLNNDTGLKNRREQLRSQAA